MIAGIRYKDVAFRIDCDSSRSSKGSTFCCDPIPIITGDASPGDCSDYSSAHSDFSDAIVKLVGNVDASIRIGCYATRKK